MDKQALKMEPFITVGIDMFFDPRELSGEDLKELQGILSEFPVKPTKTPPPVPLTKIFSVRVERDVPGQASRVEWRREHWDDTLESQPLYHDWPAVVRLTEFCRRLEKEGKADAPRYFRANMKHEAWVSLSERLQAIDPEDDGCRRRKFLESLARLHDWTFEADDPQCSIDEAVDEAVEVYELARRVPSLYEDLYSMCSAVDDRP